jgi:ABC-type antimicrobial peptide transport system permease subunit
MGDILNLGDTGTMDEHLADWFRSGILMAALLSACAAIGAFLAFVGIFGIATVYVSSQVRDFGIRLSLGAQKAAIVGLVVKRVGRVVVWGAAGGVLVSGILAKLASQVFYGTGGIEPALFIVVPIVVLLVTIFLSIVASSTVLRRAPSELLRS